MSTVCHACLMFMSVFRTLFLPKYNLPFVRAIKYGHEDVNKKCNEWSLWKICGVNG